MANEPEQLRVHRRQRQSGGFSFLAFLAFVLALALVGWEYWQWQQTAAEPAELQIRLRALEEQAVRRDDFITQIESYDSRIAELREEARQAVIQTEEARSEALEGANTIDQLRDDSVEAVQSFERRLSMLEDGLSSLERPVTVAAPKQGIDSDDLLVTQTQLLVRLGYQQLTLFESPRDAARTLRQAEETLAEVEDPAYASVRRALLREIDAVEQIPRTDLTAISSELLALQARVDDLPLRTSASKSPGPARDTETPDTSMDDEAGDGALDRLERAAKGWFVVRRKESADPLLQFPESELLVRENLKLRLESARIAALRGESDLFEQNLSAAGQLIERFFRAEATSVERTLGQIDQLRESIVAPELPEIGSTLNQLRAVRRLEGGAS